VDQEQDAHRAAEAGYDGTWEEGRGEEDEYTVLARAVQAHVVDVSAKWLGDKQPHDNSISAKQPAAH
jgi:hypothetical protein